jgi:hypothetical protein
MQIIEKFIIVLFSILCATTIPDANETSVYLNPEQELAFRLEKERVEDNFRKVVEEDVQRQRELNILHSAISIAYSAYAPFPVPGSDLANYITEKVKNFNELTGSEGCIYFDEDIPDLSVTTITVQAIGFGQYPQEGE